MSTTLQIRHFVNVLFIRQHKDLCTFLFYNKHLTKSQ